MPEEHEPAPYAGYDEHSGSPQWVPAPSGPPQPHRGSSWPLIALLVAGLLLGGGVAAWIVTAPDDTVVARQPSEGQSASGPESPAGTAAPASSSSSASSSSTTSSSSSTTSEEDPEERLQELRRDSLERYSPDGRYTVALSAKWDGVTDTYQKTQSGSHTFRTADILALHEALERRYSAEGNIYLLLAKDIGSAKGGDHDNDMWMTILDPGGLSTSEDAESWCESTFADVSDDVRKNRCYPRELDAP